MGSGSDYALLLRFWWISVAETAPPIGLEYEVACGVIYKWIRLDATFLETNPGKTGKKKIVLVRVDGALMSENCRSR